MKLVTGNSNLKLARDISKYVDLELSNCDVKRFADNEIFVEMKENVRGEDVFVIQSTSFPANDNLMELLIIQYQKLLLILQGYFQLLVQLL